MTHAAAHSAFRSPEPRLWLFNLDAPLELESPGPYQSSERFLAALQPIIQQARALMLPGDAALEPGAAPDPGWEGHVGDAWSPTPSALRQLARAGARLAPSPDIEVLRRVNHRRFYLELGGGAPGAEYVSRAAELDASLRAAELRPALFKRPYGFAGRGQRRIQAASADDERWLAASLRRGGLLVEPWLEIALELGLHGWIDTEGQLQLGQITVQETNKFRCWLRTRLARPDELPGSQVRALLARAEAVAEALWRAGYFGPFGIDAYLFRTPRGALELNTLGELNARYTMGFGIGMSEPPT
jgi:hypothetical protein